MAITGALIGAGLSAAGSIYGAIQSARANRKARKEIREQQRAIAAEKQANRSWFNRRYNEDALQRADAQRLLAEMERRVSERNKSIDGIQGVMGGITEQTAAARDANNRVISETAGNLAANAAAQKDSIEARYLQREDNFNKEMADTRAQLAGIHQARAKNVAGATSALLGVAGNIAVGLDGDGKTGTRKAPKAPVNTQNSLPDVSTEQASEVAPANTESNPATQTGAAVPSGSTATALMQGVHSPEEEELIRQGRLSRGIWSDYYGGI